MFSRHQASETVVAERPMFVDPGAPSRACCCPARPVVKIMMPPGPGHPRPVDLWLCGHHFRASAIALELAGATVAGSDHGTFAPGTTVRESDEMLVG